MMAEFRFPKRSQRVTAWGRTGSGKTWGATWLLLHSEFDKMPYVIVDYKGDDLLSSIEGVKEIGLHERLPKSPGLYYLKPKITESDEMESWLWGVHAKENTGLYFDEAYMLPNSRYQSKGALQAILTQGRSKHIPVIALVQRPSQISLFVFSEADFYMGFHLNRIQDRKTVNDLVDGTFDGDLPEFHWRWHSVQHNDTVSMAPVPHGDILRDQIEMKLRPKRRMI